MDRSADHAGWRGVLGKLLKRVLILSVSAGLCLMVPGGRSVTRAQSDVDPGQLSLARLREFMNVVEALRSEIDRTQFDVEALAFELAFEDPGDIVDWVRDNIVYEPYSGLLRGPQGTVMSRAANSLDQSVLLARLLHDAGYEARVMRADLNERQARLVLDQVVLGQESGVALSPALVGELQLHLQEMARAVGLEDTDGVELIERLRDQDPARRLLDPIGEPLASSGTYGVLELSNLLLDSLADANVDLDGTGVEDELLKEAADYFWVEYRVGAGQWEHAHPVFADLPTEFDDIVATDQFSAEVPQELQHRIRIRVIVETKLGDELQERPVMDAWERPVANLVGVPISYANHPTSINAMSDIFRSSEALAETRFFAPVFNDTTAPGAQFFDVYGNLVPPDVASLPAAGVFQSVGGAFGDAAAAMSGDDAPQALTAQWIEYTLIKPGGDTVTHRRALLDLLGPSGREAIERGENPDLDLSTISTQLFKSVTLMVAPGTYSEAFLLDRFLEQTLMGEDALAEVIEAASREGGELPLSAASNTNEGLLLLKLFADFDSIAVEDEFTRVYRAQPSVVVFEQGLALDERGPMGYQAIDIVTNSKRAVSKASGQWQFNPEAALIHGVWESASESLNLQVVAGETGVPSQSRSAYLDTLKSIGSGGATVLIGIDDPYLEHLEIDSRSKSHVSADLAAGFVVIFPEAQLDRSQVSWWRVDRATGETLGRIGDGRGGVFTEYLKTWASGFVVATTACLLTYWTVRATILNFTQGSGDIQDVVKPKDFGRCAAFGASYATFRANLAAPKFGLQPMGARVGYSHVGINTTDTAALGLGFAFTTVLLNEFVVPADW